ncbi:MAG: alpha/beta fold hydrolase [Sulfitobacter sp.]
MIWLMLILAVVVALPLIAEYRRRIMDDAARGGATGQFVRLSQGVTHFEWFGPAHGPVIICIHGLTTPSFVWRGMTRALALSGYRVLTYDHFGRGFSDRPSGVQDQRFFLQQLGELLAHEGVEDNLTLVGYSMGGAVATAFAGAYPDRVSQLILLASAGTRPLGKGLIGFIKNTPLLGDWLVLALYPALLRKGLRAERDIPGSVPNINDLQLQEMTFRGFFPAVLASLRGILSENLPEAHKTIAARGIPVLAIWGREDVLIPLSAVGRLAEWHRDARQEVLDGAGHGLTYTHTDDVLRLMRGWMKNPPDGSKT